MSERKQRKTISANVDASKPAALIINVRFNGLTHFCGLTGYKTSTAHGWLTSGYIPARSNGRSNHAHILEVATANDIEMEPADFVERPVDMPAPAHV